EAYRGELLAVTGTNGKSTVVHLLGLMLEVLPGGAETAGNIGRPMLDLLAPDEQPARVVLELSSFQLERCETIRPDWAALLNVQPDHADMHEDFASYRAAKLRLFEAQGENDAAMLPADASWNELAHELMARGVRVRRFGMVPDTEAADAGVCSRDGSRAVFWRGFAGVCMVEAAGLRLRGTHQHLNLAVAAQAAADFGVSDGVIREALTSFRGLPHRLQFVGRRCGRDWYDDSKATNPDAAAAALSSFDRVVWICGGLAKGLDLSSMIDAVRRHVVMGLVIGRKPEPFAKLMREAGVPCRVAGDMERAVALAAETAPGGELAPVLLAPAAASQDQFRDYAERGARFAAAVAALEPAL
ncbi:MAG: UDP-N-acetylmuramoyl-L-alanine--D-glutamate ligase, partial [Planctomycetota bacterium]